MVISCCMHPSLYALLLGALLFHVLSLPKFQMMTLTERPGLDAFPGAASWLVYPWEPRFAARSQAIHDTA